MTIPIQNAEVLNEISNKTRIGINENLPRQLGETIVPVLEITPRYNIFNVSSTITNSTGGIMYTTSLIKRTFLIGAVLDVIKDVTATSTLSAIFCTPKGKANSLFLGVSTTTTTAEQKTNSIILPIGIELERGSTLTCTNSTSNANIVTRPVFFIYELDK